MEGVDKEKVQKVIYEMSMGSKYFENEQRKEAVTKQKIEHLREQCAKLTDNDISHFQKVQNNMLCASFCLLVLILLACIPCLNLDLCWPVAFYALTLTDWFDDHKAQLKYNENL